MTESAQKTNIRLTGLDCADCAAGMAKSVQNLPGVQHVTLNFAAGTLSVVHTAPLEEIVRVIRTAGYGAQPESDIPAPAEPVSFLTSRRRLLVTAASGMLLAVAWLLERAHVPIFWLPIALFLLATVVGGLRTFRRGLFSLRTLTFDMNALMTLAVTGALIIRQWEEAASVAFLYSVSNLLESYTMEKTRQSIRGLMDLAPREALVRRDGNEVRVPIEELQLDELVIVKPGEKIPVDGVVVDGASAVDQSAITGESIPAEKGVGDEVFAGTLNTLGALEVRAGKLPADTALAHIIHLVEQAQEQRAPTQAFVDRFARWYTPAALALAAALMLVPPLAFAEPWMTWFYRGLTVLVVACPCALVISTPVAIVTAIGAAARYGVLIKGGAYLEQMGRVQAVAFDKTGTLTAGRPAVTDVIALNDSEPAILLGLAAAIESRAVHPLAEAITHAARHDRVPIPEATDFTVLPGRGASAVIDGIETFIGSAALFHELGVDTAEADTRLEALRQQGKTGMLLGTRAGVTGVIAAADAVRPQSAPTIAALHRLGVKHVGMLTGDNPSTAAALAAQIGLDEFTAGLLPDQKVGAVRQLQAQHGTVAMVGDGINDAPALATADVGIAMGAAGSDTALETADAALMGDDLSRLPFLMRLSRATLSIITQNIALALGFKAAALILIFTGQLTLWLAVIADMGASLLVTTNSLRLLGQKPDCHDSGCACGDGHDDHGHGGCRDGCCGGH